MLRSTCTGNSRTRLRGVRSSATADQPWKYRMPCGAPAAGRHARPRTPCCGRVQRSLHNRGSVGHMGAVQRGHAGVPAGSPWWTGSATATCCSARRTTCQAARGSQTCMVFTRRQGAIGGADWLAGWLVGGSTVGSTLTCQRPCPPACLLGISLPRGSMPSLRKASQPRLIVDSLICSPGAIEAPEVRVAPALGGLDRRRGRAAAGLGRRRAADRHHRVQNCTDRVCGDQTGKLG